MNRPSKNKMWGGMLAAALMFCAQAMGQAVRDGYAEALPTFTSGPHAGKHAVYQHEKFLAWFDAKGELFVQPLNAGKPVGKAFSCLTVAPYYSAKGTTYTRRMKRFQDFSQPAVIPSKGGKIRIKGRVEDDIPFTADYTFEGNTIQATGGCQDKPNTKPASNFRLLTRFPATHSFPATTPTPEIEAATAGMILELYSTGQSTVVHPFAKAIRSLHGPYAAMIVRGAYAPRVITFKPTGREGRLQGYIYEGRRPWQGFYVQYITQGKKINLSQNEATMIVE